MYLHVQVLHALYSEAQRLKESICRYHYEGKLLYTTGDGGGCCPETAISD